MTAWNTNMTERPEGRPILLKMNAAPIGWSVGNGETVTLGQVGNGSVTGIWTSDGFFPDVARKKGEPTTSIFIAWAEVPE